EINESITSSRMDDAEIEETIEKLHREFGYTADPHTACAFQGLDTLETAVVLATAHPAKFPDVVKQCTEVEPMHPSLEALKKKAIKKYPMTPDEEAIKAFIRSKQ